ncbi:MAG: tetratricopeptide repeat protein [Holophagales bacterium]|nr:tetratricopeptide repeat protein [Holophagales bacterium]MYJ24015.1 tetratricopeptide repeat protein [Holophagales bacterium]
MNGSARALGVCVRSIAVVLLPMALLACGPGPDEPPASPAEPTIPHPELAELDPPLARELEARRAGLDALLADQEASIADQAQAFGSLGRLYQAHRLLEPALACYREAHALDPESFAWAYYLGVLAAGAGDIETARPAFRRALELRADDAPTLVRLADLELEHGQVDEAELLYVRAAVVDDSAAVAYGMGRVAEERGEYAEAIAQFQRALTLQPRASVIHYNLGQAYRELGEFDRAEEALARSGPNRVAMADPLMHELTTLAIGALPHLDRGHAAAREGRLADAESAYRQAVAADAASVRAHESLATLLVRRGDPEGAIEHFGVAVRLDPENAQAQSDLGLLLAELGRNDRALEHLGRAVELDPGNGEARLGLGAVLAQTGSFEEAVVELLAALGQVPESRRTPRLHFGLAEALVRTGRLEEAVPHYARARELDPGQSLAWLREATVLMGLGRFADARATLDERLRVDSTDGRAAHSLARLLAGAPDRTLRDGPRAMAIAGALLQADNAAPNAETAAMALAEVGRFEEAVSIQRTLVAEARRRGRTGEERRLARNLERYERSEACCARVADAFPPY